MNQDKLREERAQRVRRSEEFLDHIASDPRVRLMPSSAQTVDEETDRSDRLTAELTARLELLRLATEPRRKLPSRIATHPLLRHPKIASMLLRALNGWTAPSRANLLLLAECIELMGMDIAKIRRARCHEE